MLMTISEIFLWRHLLLAVVCAKPSAMNVQSNQLLWGIVTAEIASGRREVHLPLRSSCRAVRTRHRIADMWQILQSRFKSEFHSFGIGSGQASYEIKLSASYHLFKNQYRGRLGEAHAARTRFQDCRWKVERRGVIGEM